jgi:hypothetical protein
MSNGQVIGMHVASVSQAEELVNLSEIDMGSVTVAPLLCCWQQLKLREPHTSEKQGGVRLEFVSVWGEGLMIRLGYVVRESYRECDLSPCYYVMVLVYYRLIPSWYCNGSTQSNSKGGPCLQNYLSDGCESQR